MLIDRVADKDIDQPGAVLSSSQSNALAVSIFLALNLGLARLPLDTVMLDDPLHSLDDVNLLGPDRPLAAGEAVAAAPNLDP